MSKLFLYNLNGGNTGSFKNYLDAVALKEPELPDIFLFSDYFTWGNFELFEKGIIHSDDRTSVIIEDFEELPKLNLPLHGEIVHFSEESTVNGRVIFLNIRIESKQFGSFNRPVVYVFAENEAFCGIKLIPEAAKISHIVHVRYGNGFGGGSATGAWLLNILKKMSCELFITDNHHDWQTGDYYALELFTSFEDSETVNLTYMRTVNGAAWSNHDDVSWYLVF